MDETSSNLAAWKPGSLAAWQPHMLPHFVALSGVRKMFCLSSVCEQEWEKATTMTAPKITANSNAKAKATCQWAGVDPNGSVSTSKCQCKQEQNGLPEGSCYPLATWLDTVAPLPLHVNVAPFLSLSFSFSPGPYFGFCQLRTERAAISPPLQYAICHWIFIDSSSNLFQLLAAHLHICL